MDRPNLTMLLFYFSIIIFFFPCLNYDMNPISHAATAHHREGKGQWSMLVIDFFFGRNMLVMVALHFKR